MLEVFLQFFRNHSKSLKKKRDCDFFSVHPKMVPEMHNVLKGSVGREIACGISNSSPPESPRFYLRKFTTFNLVFSKLKRYNF